MPQMAPISWLTLFLIFSISLILFNIINYFSYLTMSPKSSNQKKLISNSLNWKW